MDGWFIMENPIRMDDLGEKTHYFRKHPYTVSQCSQSSGNNHLWEGIPKGNSSSNHPFSGAMLNFQGGIYNGMSTGFWTLLTSFRQGEEPEAQEPMPEDTMTFKQPGGRRHLVNGACEPIPEPTKILDFLNIGVPNSRRRKCYANVRNHLPTEL